MTLLDAYALIAFLVGGPATRDVRGLLREGDAAVATANLAEALDVSQRLYGLPIDRAVEILDPLLEGPLSLVPLDLAVARRAAEIRARHYHRSSRPISLADAGLIASCGKDDRIATADPDVLAVGSAEELETVALPGQARPKATAGRGSSAPQPAPSRPSSASSISTRRGFEPS